MRHLDILRRMRREAEEAYRRVAEGEREERRKRAEASRRFKEVVKAEKLAGEWELDYYEMSLEDFLARYGVRPVFKELWELARSCADVRSCYRVLAYFHLEKKEAELQLVREAAKLGADVEMVANLLYQGKTEEAAKLLRR